jgi:hypothetical protein
MMGDDIYQERDEVLERYSEEYIVMGRTPIPIVIAPDRESFHIGRARNAYLAGQIDVYTFEELVWHVLSGGHLSQDLMPR